MTRHQWLLAGAVVGLVGVGLLALHAQWSILIGAALALWWEWRKRRFRPRSAPRPVWTAPLSDDWDSGSGTDFEQRLGTALNRIGWSVRPTPITGDFGADLVGTDGAGTTWVIQCKHTRGAVGVHGVQEVLGARAFYATQGALVATTGHFTRAAWTLANRAHVTLWDRGRVLALRNQAARTGLPRRG